jgi:prevent-host-death family protein
MILRLGDLVEKLVDAHDIRDQIERVLEDVSVRGDHVIVENRGEAVAAVVPLRLYEQWKRERDNFFDIFEDMARNADMSPEEADALALEAVAAVRAERRSDVE